MEQEEAHGTLSDTYRNSVVGTQKRRSLFRQTRAEINHPGVEIFYGTGRFGNGFIAAHASSDKG